MIFIGDALFPGGNDYPAKEAGALCIFGGRVADAVANGMGSWTFIIGNV